jgi:hypothetical protein
MLHQFSLSYQKSTSGLESYYGFEEKLEDNKNPFIHRKDLLFLVAVDIHGQFTISICGNALNEN